MADNKKGGQTPGPTDGHQTGQTIEELSKVWPVFAFEITKTNRNLVLAAIMTLDNTIQGGEELTLTGIFKSLTQQFPKLSESMIGAIGPKVNQENGEVWRLMGREPEKRPENVLMTRATPEGEHIITPVKGSNLEFLAIHATEKGQIEYITRARHPKTEKIQFIDSKIREHLSLAPIKDWWSLEQAKKAIKNLGSQCGDCAGDKCTTTGGCNTQQSQDVKESIRPAALTLNGHPPPPKPRKAEAEKKGTPDSKGTSNKPKSDKGDEGGSGSNKGDLKQTISDYVISLIFGKNGRSGR